MSNEQKSPKSQSLRKLVVFTAINIAIFWVLFFKKEATINNVLNNVWKRITYTDGIIAAGLPICVLLLNGILSDKAKAVLVFWRFKNPLPGCRAFSMLMLSDPRIDVNSLKKRLGKLPTDPMEENRLWYRLYRKHETKATVMEAHKVYLLVRDMAALSAIFAVVLCSGIIVNEHNLLEPAIYAFALVAQYLVTSVSARNYGNRFVTNVLAVESTEQKS